MAEKQDWKKINEWQKENTERIVIVAPKKDNLTDNIKQAIDAGKATSRQGYIISAIKTALTNDGILGVDSPAEKITTEEIIIDSAKIIKQLLIERNMTVNDLAKRLNIQPKTLKTKLGKNIFTLNEFAACINALDSQIEIRTTDTNKVYKQSCLQGYFLFSETGKFCRGKPTEKIHFQKHEMIIRKQIGMRYAKAELVQQ